MAEQMKGVRYIEVVGTNVSSLSINVSSLFVEGFTPPRKWELLGSQWGSVTIGIAEGLVRYDTNSSSSSANVIDTSGFSGSPSVTIDSDGIFAVRFGMQWSFARLRMFY